jgi:cation transport regulator ChaB
MGVLKGDVIFARSGMPQTISNKDDKTGKVTFESDFPKIQKEVVKGVKNGLSESARSEYTEVLNSAEDSDKRQEIRNLSSKIQELKKESKDARLIRYLEGELGYRMNREKYTPEGYEVDPSAITSY